MIGDGLVQVAAPAARGRTLALARLRVVGLGAATALSGVAVLAASGWLITRAAEHPPILSLLCAIVVVRALGLVRAFARYAERLASHDLAFRMLGAERLRWYRRLAARVPGRGAPRSADLLARFVGDVDELQHLEVRVLAPPAVAAVAALAMAGTAALILPVAGAVLAAGLVLAMTAPPALAYLAARRAIHRQGAARAAVAGELDELLALAPQLAVAGQRGPRLARLDAATAALDRLGRRDARAAAAAGALATLVAGATLLGVLLVTVGPAARGELGPVWLGALALLALGGFEAAAELPEAATRAAAVAAARRRLAAAVAGPEILPAPAKPRPLGVPAATLGHPIALAATGLRHRPGGPDGPLVVDGVDLRIALGERVALVGPSGAGKTTLAHLLARLADPDEGEVAVGGVPLRDADPAAVRAWIRLAGQDAHLFATSIAANVRIGAPGAGDAEVDAALRVTGLGPWLDALPDGAATLVGEDGLAVSGGQRQRIALARALVSPAQVLILDEPTAMLDPPAARAFLADLERATAGRTVLVVTHERHGLTAFDRVLELRDGRLTPA